MPLPIVGDGNQRRDFTHVFDIVDGLIKDFNSDIKHDDAWELGTGVNYSVNEFFKCLKKNLILNAVIFLIKEETIEKL